mmetsp:Transcript_59379/g.140212  ORF Transcript_59379/g.140212 Transcript_59379/m.140212 type:complete len:282 (+) Transcript_59379:437-1282(+)
MQRRRHLRRRPSPRRWPDGPVPRNPDRRPDGRHAVFADRARLRADLQGQRGLQLRARGDGAVRSFGHGTLCRVVAQAHRPGRQAAGEPAGLRRGAGRDGRGGLAGGEARPVQAREPGRDHAADGHARHRLPAGGRGPDAVRQRHLQDRHRSAQGPHVPVRADLRRRPAGQQGRPLRGADRRGAGCWPVALLPEDRHRPRTARRGRRPPGRAEHRHPAVAHLGHRLERGRLRRAGGRHDLGQQAGRAVLAVAGGAQGPAGGHPGRPHQRAGRHRRRSADWRG